MAGPGDTLFLRESGEPVRVLAVLDGTGTLLVAAESAGDGEPFQVAPDEVESALDRRRGCGCC